VQQQQMITITTVEKVCNQREDQEDIPQRRMVAFISPLIVDRNYEVTIAFFLYRKKRLTLVTDLR
jgi:hypothetical protein